MIHRHPSRMRLAAWFDGEAERTIGDHVRHCARCRSYVQSLGAIRAAVRGDEPAPEFTRHRRPTVVVAIAASFAVLVAFSAAWAGPFHERVQGVLSLFGGGSVTHHVTATSRPSPRLSARSSTSASTHEASGAVAGNTVHTVAPHIGHRGLPERASPPAPALPALRLAVLVPTTGSDAAEGTDVVKAVRTVVSAANKEGGVWGRHIRFFAVPDNGHAPKGTSGAVFVGGFGAARGASWLLPADPTARGTGVVSGEVSPRAAGVVLGRELKRQGMSGPVGVILGAGPDAAFASGLAEVVPVKKVRAQPGAPCAAEVLAFRQQGVSALAVAGPPDLQARCANAAAGQVWLAGEDAAELAQMLELVDDWLGGPDRQLLTDSLARFVGAGGDDLGVVAGGSATWFRQRRWRRAARQHEADARRARAEITDLRAAAAVSRSGPQQLAAPAQRGIYGTAGRDKQGATL